MSRRSALIFLAFLATAAGLPARTWKSADGRRSIEGDFVKRDKFSVTIRNGQGAAVTINLSELHPDTRKWLDANHPAASGGVSGPADAPAPDANAVFDTLKFGDSRDEVLAKLKASKVVEMVGDETFIGRSGMNGVFKTRKKIGSLEGFLYFDWDGDGGLKELTLQTATIPAANYRSELEPSWKSFVDLITTLYGKPTQHGPMPSMQSIPDGSLMPSHLWSLENGTSILLGTARDGDKYQLVVRFTRKKIRPVALP